MSTNYNTDANNHSSLILNPLRITAGIAITAGVWSLLFEIYYFRDFSLGIYSGRVLASIVAFSIFASTYFNLKVQVLLKLVHVLLLSIVGSFALTIYLIPETLYINSQILALIIFTSAIIFNWEFKQQIIVAIYYNLLFAASVLMTDKSIYFLPSFFSTVIFVSFISLMSIFASSINYRLRRKYTDKTEEAKRLFENSQVGIFKARLSGELDSFNLSFRNIFNKARNKITSDNIAKLFDSHTSFQDFLETLTEKKIIDSFKTCFESSNDEMIYLNISAKLIGDNKNDTVIEGSIVNITGEVNAGYEQQKLARIALNEKNQKIQLLAKINHEVRTPLNSILMLLQMVEENMMTDINELKKFVGPVKNSVENLLNAIDNYLEFSKIEVGKAQVNISDFDIRREINSIVKLLEPLFNAKQIELKVDVRENVPTIVFSDLSKYRQVLINLIGNAIKFMKTGHINIVVQFNENESGKFFMTTVQDNGPGIPKKNLESLFRPYYTLENSEKSTGLGLLICYEFVHLLNGTISVQSEVGKGSEFTFKLPVAEVGLIDD